MKIFWSWQSDTPGKIGRHFVKDAIQEAINKLKEEAELDEPERDSNDASREDLHLDHDRKGVPGSPDLANTILAKIRESSVFIADVTPVGNTSDKKKAILNPNVGIELGYALAQIGDKGFLMILNTFHGDRDTLPFDLKHKTGPIIYSLAPNATKEQRAKQRQSLVDDLKTAIGDCIAHVRKEDPTATRRHDEIKCKEDCSVYFDYNEPLDRREIQGRQVTFAYNRCPLLYLRVIPINYTPPLEQAEVKNVDYRGEIEPFDKEIRGTSWARNDYGGIRYLDADGERASSQIFFNREIWGLNATTLLDEAKVFPMEYIEPLYTKALKHYVEVAQKSLGLTPPLYVEAGASGVAGFSIRPGRHQKDQAFKNEITSRQTLSVFDEKEVSRVLVSIFEDFFDAFGKKRPDNFRSFP